VFQRDNLRTLRVIPRPLFPQEQSLLILRDTFFSRFVSGNAQL
jgi:hypothetical protein